MGRQLKGITGTNLNVNYKYNDSGIRTEKTVNGVTTKYHLLGDRVTFESNGTDNIYYTYDSSNNLLSMNLNGAEYYYIRNVQGDIIGLHDKDGKVVVNYVYDSWGKLISTTGSLVSTVGVKNPYRYRGYRYDTETGLYYLQSRYYNSDWGRFINADGIVGQKGELLGHNLFAYCKNNPVNMVDNNGQCAWFIPLGILAGEFIEAAIISVGAVVIIHQTVKLISSSPSMQKAKSRTKVHGNSKQSKKPQHGYEIYNKKTGDVVKVGISGGKVRLDGKSYRAEKQVRAFNRFENDDIYESRIMEYFPDRQSALDWEWTDSQFRYSQGHSMRYHKRPAFDNWWDPEI